jgi:hypothetical protein
MIVSSELDRTGDDAPAAYLKELDEICLDEWINPE